MRKKCYAKLNIALNVLDKTKPKALHSLDMVNVKINLNDVLIMKTKQDNLNNILIECNNSDIPLNESNLVYKVIEKFKKIFSLSFSCKIIINKKIPTQAGLGGGSSNAAAALDLLDKKFKTNMSIIQKVNFLKTITSDGPYMLVDKTCRVRGNGEIISPLKKGLNSKIFIVKPFKGCSTKAVFDNIDYKNIKRFNINKLCDAIEQKDFKLLASHTGNSLIDSSVSLSFEIEDVLNRLKACGFEIISMSGSGSTCFALSKSKYP